MHYCANILVRVCVLSHFSHVWLFVTLWPVRATEKGSHFLLQGIFPTQRSNPGISHCRQILYHLSHKGSTRILEWVAHPFSSRSSWPRNRTRVSWIQADFLPTELSANPHDWPAYIKLRHSFFRYINALDQILPMIWPVKSCFFGDF